MKDIRKELVKRLKRLEAVSISSPYFDHQIAATKKQIERLDHDKNTHTRKEGHNTLRTFTAPKTNHGVETKGGSEEHTSTQGGQYRSGQEQIPEPKTGEETVSGFQTRREENHQKETASRGHPLNRQDII